jgi:hypothetical protein
MFSAALAITTVPTTRREKDEMMLFLELKAQDVMYQNDEKAKIQLFRDFASAYPPIKNMYSQLYNVYQKAHEGIWLRKKNIFGKQTAKYKSTMKKARIICNLALNEFEVQLGYDLSSYGHLRSLVKHFFDALEKKIDRCFT